MTRLHLSEHPKTTTNVKMCLHSTNPPRKNRFSPRDATILRLDSTTPMQPPSKQTTLRNSFLKNPESKECSMWSRTATYRRKCSLTLQTRSSVSKSWPLLIRIRQLRTSGLTATTYSSQSLHLQTCPFHRLCKSILLLSILNHQLSRSRQS